MNTWFYAQLVKKILDGSYWVCLAENRHLNFRVFRKSDYNGKSSVDNLTPDKVVWKPIKWEKWTFGNPNCHPVCTFETVGLEILGFHVLLNRMTENWQSTLKTSYTFLLCLLANEIKSCKSLKYLLILLYFFLLV